MKCIFNIRPIIHSNLKAIARHNLYCQLPNYFNFFNFEIYKRRLNDITFLELDLVQTIKFDYKPLKCFFVFSEKKII